MDNLIVVKGGGDLATGIGHRLWQAGFPIVITETAEPMVIRRMASFAEAVYRGLLDIEGVRARLATNLLQAQEYLEMDQLPVIVDPQADIVQKMRPLAVVDAIMAKQNMGTRIDDAPIVIGVGPGFQAGLDVHAVIETKRGHNLGKVIWQGKAEPNSGVPGDILGYTWERVIYSPCSGDFRAVCTIGELVASEQVIGYVGGQEVKAAIPGVLRGILQDGLTINKGTKLADIDPSGVKNNCFTISDKARAVGGGVLEAVMNLSRRLNTEEKDELNLECSSKNS